MDLISDLFGGLFDLLKAFAIFFVISIGALIAFSLYRSMCPSCNKLRAAKYEGSSRERGLIFMRTSEHLKCKYCGHRWSRELNDD